MTIDLLRPKVALYIVASVGLAAYFLYDYGLVTGGWMVGSLIYVACLFLLFPALREIRFGGFETLHWLDWLRLAFIPVFALLANLLAPWLPLATITALGLATSLFVVLVKRRRPSRSEVQ